MSEEADSFNMEAAQESLASELFPSDEVKEEIVEEATEEVTNDVTDEEAEDTKEETEETKEEVRAAPQSWKKEMHDHWSKLDPEVQDYFELREKQMKEGIDVAKEDADLGRSLRDVISPYNKLLEAQNLEQGKAVQYLMNAHAVLSTGDEQTKIDGLNKLANAYGIKLDGTKVTPEVQNLQKEVNQLKGYLSQSHEASQQERQAEITKEVDAFASEHDLFDEVADDIVPFINSGLSLQEAYDKAVWSNPITRQKMQDLADKEKADKIADEKEKKVQKAQKAKSTNVNSRDTSKAPTEPLGKMFDDMHDTYREIQNR